VLSGFGLTEFPKSSGSHDRSALETFQDKQVFVAGYNSLRVSGQNQAEHHQVVGIATRLGIKFLGPHQFDVLPTRRPN
jgi:hypothetical protein